MAALKIYTKLSVKYLWQSPFFWVANLICCKPFITALYYKTCWWLPLLLAFIWSIVLTIKQKFPIRKIDFWVMYLPGKYILKNRFHWKKKQSSLEILKWWDQKCACFSNQWLQACRYFLRYISTSQNAFKLPLFIATVSTSSCGSKLAEQEIQLLHGQN